MKLNIVRLDKDVNFPMPSPPNPGDAGIDLIAANGGMINPGDNQLVGCGFAVEIPEGYVGLVCPRSGLAAKYHIAVGNAPGIIDASYRGEVKIILEHRGHKYTGAFQWKRGDRLAQLVIAPYFAVSEINVVSELPESGRGANGFGSSGVATAAASVESKEAVAYLEAINAADDVVDVETLELIETINAPRTTKKKGSK